MYFFTKNVEIKCLNFCIVSQIFCVQIVSRNRRVLLKPHTNHAKMS